MFKNLEGQRIPDVTFRTRQDHEWVDVASKEIFAGKNVVVFSLPGAFTPTCSEAHLPGFIVKADEIKAKGVSDIICLSVNDAFVMKSWGEAQNAEEITMLADGGAAFTKAIGLEMDTADFGGVRSQRYAMIVDDGVVTALNVEKPGAFEASSAEAILEAL